MKFIPNFADFIVENEKITESTAVIKVNPINNVKSGQKIWRLMDRYNPQLGTYYVFSEVTITRVNAKSISCDDNSIYSRENGKRQGKGSAGYGSADYTIMTHEDAVENESILNSSGAKVRGLK
jgi:hypothetical protein